jgi:hypothetical protein
MICQIIPHGIGSGLQHRLTVFYIATLEISPQTPDAFAERILVLCGISALMDQQLVSAYAQVNSMAFHTELPQLTSTLAFLSEKLNETGKPRGNLCHSRNSIFQSTLDS